MKAGSMAIDLLDPTGEWTRVLFEAIDDAVFVHDLEGNILEANQAASRRLGYTREELLRLNTRDIDDPEFAAEYSQRLQMQLQSQLFRFEGRHRTKDGRIVSVDINTSTVRLQGKPAILAVMRDITQRKDTEEALARQSGLLQSILDNMGDAVVVTDREKRILVYNPAAQRIFGFPPLKESLGKVIQPTYLFLPDQATPFPEEFLPLRRCIQGEEVDELEMFVRAHPKAPGHWISVTGRALRDEEGQIKGGVVVCRDITERRRSRMRMETQYAVAQVLASGESLEVTVPNLLQVLCEGLGFDQGSLWVMHAGDNLLQCLDSWSHPAVHAPEFLTMTRRIAFPPGLGLPGQVLVRGEPVLLENFDSNRSVYPRSIVAAREGLVSALGYPIKSGGETIGVLEFFACSTLHADDALNSMMRALGSQIGQFMERHRVEKALRDSEALYHSLVESLPQNIFRKDLAGRFTFGNQRYCNTVKLSRQELLGKTDFDLFPRELASKYVQDDQEVIQTGKTFETIEDHRLPDGTPIFVQVVKTPIHDAQGNIIGTQGMFWDVTAQKRAVEALAESEVRYRQLTEATLDGIIVVDQDQRITLFNPAAARMFDYQPEELLGQPVTVLIPARFHEAHQRGFERFLSTGNSDNIGHTLEFLGRRKDGGEFPVEIALSVLSRGGLPGPDGREPMQFLGAMRDLTERNKIRSILVQNEKLVSIGMLSAGVAHEINNPLAFVGNNLAVLERDCQGLLKLLEYYESLQEKLANLDPVAISKVKALAEAMDLPYTRDNLPRLLQRTREGVDRVTRIVHSLRGLARTDTPKRQETPLPDLVDTSVEILRGRLKKSNIEVKQDHDPVPRVSCVTTQISQVILNLLVNAVQAIEAYRKDGGQILVRTRRQQGEMVLEIIDNGCGINPENMQRLFDPFFTTKDVGEGTGLGLSITHNIVAAHGGHVEVDSLPGQGATFRIFLPLKI
jgi:PAS domain S-box-containing protein